MRIYPISTRNTIVMIMDTVRARPCLPPRSKNKLFGRMRRSFIGSAVETV